MKFDEIKQIWDHAEGSFEKIKNWEDAKKWTVRRLKWEIYCLLSLNGLKSLKIGKYLGM